jgi:hypothetical protein
MRGSGDDVGRTMPRVASVKAWSARRHRPPDRVPEGLVADDPLRDRPIGSPVPGTRKAMSRRSDGRDFTAMMRIPSDDSWRATSRPIHP